MGCTSCKSCSHNKQKTDKTKIDEERSNRPRRHPPKDEIIDNKNLSHDDLNNSQYETKPLLPTNDDLNNSQYERKPLLPTNDDLNTSQYETKPILPTNDDLNNSQYETKTLLPTNDDLNNSEYETKPLLPTNDDLNNSQYERKPLLPTNNDLNTSQYETKPLLPTNDDLNTSQYETKPLLPTNDDLNNSQYERKPLLPTNNDLNTSQYETKPILPTNDDLNNSQYETKPLLPTNDDLNNSQYETKPLLPTNDDLNNSQYETKPLLPTNDDLNNSEYETKPLLPTNDDLNNSEYGTKPLLPTNDDLNTSQYETKPLLPTNDDLNNSQYERKPLLPTNNDLNTSQYETKPILPTNDDLNNSQYETKPLLPTNDDLNNSQYETKPLLPTNDDLNNSEYETKPLLPTNDDLNNSQYETKPLLPTNDDLNTSQYETKPLLPTNDDIVSEHPVVIDKLVDIEVGDFEALNHLFIQQRQQVIDNHSYRTIIESWQPNSLQQLTEIIKIFSEGKSFIDRHWIIFYWIACNIEYDTVSYFSKDYKDQSAEGVFRTRKGVCAGYANIYKYLCDQLQMTCEVVGGYSKGYGFDNREEAPSETDHAWNAVEIDGHWYLMESTWGAGYLNEEKTFERKLKTYYFLPRPNEMIYNHLPEDEKWQLLRTPINMIQYMQMPKLHSTYFDLNLELVSPRNQAHVDFVPDKPYALVLIRAPSDVRLIANLKLNDEKIDGGHRVVFDDQEQFYCCYFAPSTIGKHKITIYGKQYGTKNDKYDGALDLTFNVKQMPPNRMSFPKTWEKFFILGLEVVSPPNTHLIKLSNGANHVEIQIRTPEHVQLIGRLENEQKEKVLAGDRVYYDRENNIWRCQFAPDRDGFFDAMIMAKEKSDPGSYTATVAFKIDAKQTPPNRMSFPETWETFFVLGLEVISPPNTHLIKLSNGANHVEIQIRTPEHVQLIGRFENEQKEEVVGGDRVYYDRENNIWRCQFAPDRDGFFDAIIMAKGKSDSENYTSAVSFKIEAKQISSPPLSYPKTWQLFHDLDIKIETPRDQSTIVLSQNDSEVEIQLKTPDDVALLGQLCNDNDEKIEGGHQVFYDHRVELWRCQFAPDRDGHFNALIWAKKKSDPGSYTAAVTFKIEAKQISSPPISYPHTWQPFYELDLKIEAPKNRANAVWPENASYAEVLIQAPDDVILSCNIKYNDVKIENGSLAQFDHEKKLWQLLFAPEQTGPHELLIFAQRRDDTKSSSAAVVKFHLNVTELHRQIKFPITYTLFQTKRCQIYNPLDGILKTGSIVPIHCLIPGALDVNLRVDSKWLKSEGYTDQILQRQITVGSKEVIIYAKYEEKSNYNSLMKYSIL